MGNSVNLEELDPSEILESSSLKSYEETLELIWSEVLRLRSNLFILDKLLNFPHDPKYLFFGPQQQDFFESVEIALTEGTVLLITKLTTDGEDYLSMSRFKNWIRNHIKREYRADFDRLLRASKFSPTIKRSRKSVEEIRHCRIAHLIVDENLRPKVVTDKIPFQEISSIASDLKRLFGLLCFGIEHLTLPIQYEPRVQHPVGVDPRSDIEYLLDLLIQNSHLFKMPDESPYWEHEKEALSPEIIEILNEYRKKFRKPEA